ncbi:MAG: DUF1499 domain-containing protein [Kordiimonadaceae bacterium]|jgi:uncharacterized protein (DUF1499 family)|nr:DUF1499 domain-containing protein [Kordiimonadaceae bacterium]MBT6328716.1 DUF1499 domain-containing protein [Kordiimonadaceae bacterium]MBT7583732.1 DUF1499 domain-containing protein [Kordiimonadaceae bacterium]
MQKKKKNLLFKAIFIVSLLGLSPMLGGIGSGLGIWEPMTGFRMTRGYMTISSISGLVALFMIMNYFSKDMARAVKTYLIALLFAGSGYYLGVNQEPPDWTGLRGIHDVTTNMNNPPQFIALLDAPGRSNSFDYPAETAQRQQAKFPWVKPLMSDMSPTDAYARALSVANELGWDVVGEDAAAGRFEATDYTKWFNFHDDLVVKITSSGGGSRIDLRSLSRVGGSDHGLGAIRIMKFQRNFAAE